MKLEDTFSRADYDTMLQNNGRDSSDASDLRMNAQRFCFNIAIKGRVHPPVNNLSAITVKSQPLNLSYAVNIYTKSQVTERQQVGGSNPLRQLVLFPFAWAFAGITLPFQLLEQWGSLKQILKSRSKQRK